MAQLASSQNLSSMSKQQPSHETICLETHTWYAKRFHMIDKWGYKIPYYSNDKSLTASYKAITENCLLQDISYYTCIEIVGEKNWLEATLKEHCNPQKTFAEKIYTSGEKEGMVMFFKRYGYPEFPIGNVNFFWKPSETNIKTIWIWVHPAFYRDFLSEIISSFEFKQNNAEQDKTDISRNLNDLYTNDAGCEMLVLKYALNRFRLSGPAALTVLKEVLHVPSLTELDLDLENCTMTGERDRSLNDKLYTTSTGNNVSVQSVQKMIIDENEKDTKDLTIHNLRKKMWHTKYYKERANIEAFKIQEQMWQSLKVLETSRFLLSNIIGLTVLDPRFYLPVRNTKTEIHSFTKNIRCHLSSDLNRSPLWDAQIRNIVSNSCVFINTGNKLRRESLVPDMSDDPYFNNNVVTKIPILLVQKPAVATSDFRIDIIIPSGWAMAFWTALIMRSPLVGGLRETKLEVFENLTTCVPDINDPDTPAYMREALTRKEELINEYFSHSPIQRVNFIEFGIYSPFFCDWKNLIKGWSDVENFYVLRHLRLLAFLRMKIKTVERKNARTKSTIKESEFNLQDLQIAYKNCLVQVQLSMVSEGTPKNFAIICMPKRKDLRRFENNRNYDGPVEKCHTDENKMLREILCRIHWMQLEPLSRHEIIERKSNLEDNVLPEEYRVLQDEINDAKLPNHRITLSDHAKKMRKLYLPESTEVRHSCDREVMGYVTMGSFSFFRAKNIGIGYVALPSLLKIIREKSNIVLVRNIKELQYRLARLDVLVDINDRYL